MSKIPIGFIKETNENSGSNTISGEIKTDMIFEPNVPYEEDVEVYQRSKPITKKSNRNNSKLLEYKYRRMKDSRDGWRILCVMLIIIIGLLVMRVYHSGYIYDIFGRPAMQQTEQIQQYEEEEF